MQRAQHMVATECQVVLVARMTLVTQLALVTSSVTGFMEALVTWLVPEAPSAAGEPGGAAGAILQISGPPHAPGPSGNAAPGTRCSNRDLRLYPIPGTLVGQGPRGTGCGREVWFGGLQVVLKCRRRALWRLGYGSEIGQAARGR